MEKFCANNNTQSKFRPCLATTNFYHNVPYGRNLRTNEYAMPHCSNRRSTPQHTHWQECHSQRSYMGRKQSRGKFCSITLIICSFLVLVIVLTIAGIAFYMGSLQHTESPNSLLSFSCRAKILRGNRFLIGSSQENLSRYKLQCEALYQKSVLGTALVSCAIEKFVDESLILFFKLVFNKAKIPRNILNIEKTIRDILLSDAVSKKPTFKNMRFDPRNIQIKQISDTDLYQKNSSIIYKPNLKTKSDGLVLKLPNNRTIIETSLSVKKKPTDELQIKNNEQLPVIQGSFKISKTEADITEKKTEITTKPTSLSKLTTPSTRKTTLKEISVTSSGYKITLNEKNKTTTQSTILTTQTTKDVSNYTTPLSVISSHHLFNEDPWIPILPKINPTTQPNYENTQPIFTSFTNLPETTTSTTVYPNIQENKQLVYTSFTNPGLSFQSSNTENLGSSVTIKNHPIPINKIPITESSIFDDKLNTPTGDGETDLVKYIPVSNSNDNNVKYKEEQIFKKLSSIFHSLASSLTPDTELKSEINEKVSTTEESVKNTNIGQGQVEILDEDLMQTTKLPLVTLIPVKSNSGIGRPLRRKPIFENRDNITNFFDENRSLSEALPANYLTNLTKTSFEIIKTEVVTSVSSEEKIKSNISEEIGRNPKMKGTLSGSRNSQEIRDENNQIVVYAMNSSVSRTNILTPEKLKQLSEITKLNSNSTSLLVENEKQIISNKAITSNHNDNHAGFKLLTKKFNKIDEFKDKVSSSSTNFDLISNTTECSNFTFKCGDGQCLPLTTKCNQLVDCIDGKDETECNCADYLKSQHLLRKICDGIVDCWDYSDENNCEWCKSSHKYICGNSKTCIDKSKICDGITDCPYGDDELQCVTIAPDLEVTKNFAYHSKGYVMIRKQGKWGKFCVENFQKILSNFSIAWNVSDLGRNICKSLTYKNLDDIQEEVNDDLTKYFELDTFQNKTKPNLVFKETECNSRRIVKVKCQSLECGIRPLAQKSARIVGGGNAASGAWPWQAALYKEGEFQCGATLLSDKWLVSAGHCFYHSLEEHWVARLGALRRGTAFPSPYEQLRPINRIIIHPNYVDSGFINDISLLEMQTSVDFSDYVRPICLPQPEQLNLDGKICTVVGWGQLFEVGRIFPDTLQEVQIPIISTAECRKRTIFLPLYKITDDMFCAGYERGGRDACLGDSGGPLMCPMADGQWVLQGITSNGYGCARANRPGVYTKVANYITWINSYILSKNNTFTSNNTKNTCLGHRCPLGQCLPKNRLCNGYIECSDGSDERNC